MSATSKPRNPRTLAEWQEAADGAQVMLLIDAARQYGLIEGGPECNQERCVEILRLAKRRGITPRKIASNGRSVRRTENPSKERATMETTKAFEQWCLVEIFGKQKYAGLVTEQVIGGCNFVRLDVPETARTKSFTKLFGQGAIYAMTPIEEDVAHALAAQYDQRPVNVYELPDEVRQAMHAARRITGPTDPPERGAAPLFDFGEDDFDDSPS